MTDISEQPSRPGRSPWLYLAAGLLVGALAILAIRFVSYNPQHAHYHANHAVFINGERQQFKGQQYYQEVSLCATHDTLTPPARAHMHNQENSVVHVHHEAVTWGQFFANLGWAIGPDFIRTDDRLLGPADDGQLHVLLNGDDLTGITSIANKVIQDTDRLLVSYGQPGDEELRRQYQAVPKTATVFNTKQDPASCSGAHKVTLKDRFKNLL